MGAWGEGPFENDSAMDWLSAATENPGALPTAFDATREADYLDVDDGSVAVAAAAVVAAAVDGDVSGLPDDARDLAVEITAAALLRARAVEALDRVVAAKSELASLWGEGSGGAGFRHRIEQLRSRLTR